jgi:hypothetical protein
MLTLTRRNFFILWSMTSEVIEGHMLPPLLGHSSSGVRCGISMVSGVGFQLVPAVGYISLVLLFSFSFFIPPPHPYISLISTLCLSIFSLSLVLLLSFSFFHHPPPTPTSALYPPYESLSFLSPSFFFSFYF